MEEYSLIVIDDNEELLSLIESEVKEHYPQISLKTYRSGEEALENIKGDNCPGFIFTDLKLPNMNGLKVAQEIFVKYPHANVVAISGVVSVKEKHKLMASGLTDWLEKPFEVKQLVELLATPVSEAHDKESSLEEIDFSEIKDQETIDREVYLFNDKYGRLIKIFGQNEPINIGLIEDLKSLGKDKFFYKGKKYLPIRTSTLMAEKGLGLALFSPNDKNLFEIVVESKKDITQIELDIFKKKKLKKLFIRDNDEKEYQNYLDRCIDELCNEDIESQEKCQIVRQHGKTKLEESFDGDLEQGIEEVRKVKQRILDLIEQDRENLLGFLKEDSDQNMFEHALNISNLSILILDKICEIKRTPSKDRPTNSFDNMDMPNDEVKDILFMAAAFHQLGLHHLYKEHNTRALEKNLYQQYPQKSCEILKDQQKKLSSEVIEIISQVEEYWDGTGFPKGLSNKKLGLYQNIISIAKQFDTFRTFQGQSPKQCIEMIKSRKDKFHPDLVNILEEIVDALMKTLV